MTVNFRELSFPNVRYIHNYPIILNITNVTSENECSSPKVMTVNYCRYISLYNEKPLSTAQIFAPYN